MMKANDIIRFIKKNFRYFFAALAIFLMFLISRSFPAQVITSENCAGGACKPALDKPALSKEKLSYYVNDVARFSPGQYYRLTFLTRANKDTKLEVIITNPSDQDKGLKTIELNKSSENLPQEIIFASDGNYSDILFRKIDANDGADVNVADVRATKLEISSDKELANLRPTIRGGINIDNIDQSQTDNSYVFNQLKEPGAIFGQILKPQADYIASVTLDLDIVKQDNNGGKKYKFELREAEFDGGVPEITSNIIASVDFTAENIERFRQDDGKLRFPIYAKLDPEKFYFIGINNNNVAVDKFNYLRLKGTQGKGKYAGGTVAIKTKGKTYSAVGNLYFITHQLSFNEYQGKKILSGEVIEDIGKLKGIYTYKPLGNIYDLADLEEYAGNVEYDDDNGAIVGAIDPKNASHMIYKFNTIFPANTVRITGKQADAGWNKVSISYSYDNINWKEIPDNIADNAQYFDYTLNISPPEKEIYVKINPKETQDGEKYGINDFKVEAGIFMK